MHGVTYGAFDVLESDDFGRCTAGRSTKKLFDEDPAIPYPDVHQAIADPGPLRPKGSR